MKIRRMLAAAATITMIILTGVTIAAAPQAKHNGVNQADTSPACTTDECWQV